MGIFSSLVLLVTCFQLVFEPAFAEVGFQIVGLNENRTDFYILETSSELLLINERRQPDEPFLKLALQGGVKINKLEGPYDRRWILSLSDGSQVEVLLEDSLSAATYKIWWHGKTTHAREMCFYYGYNNASW